MVLIFAHIIGEVPLPWIVSCGGNRQFAPPYLAVKSPNGVQMMCSINWILWSILIIISCGIPKRRCARKASSCTIKSNQDYVSFEPSDSGCFIWCEISYIKLLFEVTWMVEQKSLLP